MAEFCKPRMLVQTVRSGSPPRCRSVQRRLPCLRVEAAVSSEAPEGSRTGEAFSPHGLAMKRPLSFIESEPPDKERIGRRKQGSLR